MQVVERMLKGGKDIKRNSIMGKLTQDTMQPLLRACDEKNKAGTSYDSRMVNKIGSRG